MLYQNLPFINVPWGLHYFSCSESTRAYLYIIIMGQIKNFTSYPVYGCIFSLKFMHNSVSIMVNELEYSGLIDAFLQIQISQYVAISLYTNPII